MKTLVIVTLALTIFCGAVAPTAQAIPISYGIKFNTPLHLIGFFPWPGAFVSQIGFKVWVEEIGLGLWLDLTEEYRVDAYSFQATWEAFASPQWSFDVSMGVFSDLNPIEFGGLASAELLFFPFSFLEAGPNAWIRAKPNGVRIGVGVSLYYSTNLFPRRRDAE